MASGGNRKRNRKRANGDRSLWGFLFKKTIPLFWVPAHTITFMLPPEYRVLFAALLGVMLGVFMSLATRKK